MEYTMEQVKEILSTRDFQVLNWKGEVEDTVAVTKSDLTYGCYNTAADGLFLQWCSDNGLDSDEYDWEWV